MLLLVICRAQGTHRKDFNSDLTLFGLDVKSGVRLKHDDLKSSRYAGSFIVFTADDFNKKVRSFALVVRRTVYCLVKLMRWT